MVAPMLELHYAVPGAGGVLVPLNTRLAAADYAYILEHCGPGVVVVAESLRPVLDEAVQRLGGGAPRVLTTEEYERLLEGARPAELRLPADERALLSINYTSGTTGRPKGVMTAHRGAYLHSLGVIAEAGLSARSAVPMPHAPMSGRNVTAIATGMIATWRGRDASRSVRPTDPRRASRSGCSAASGRAAVVGGCTGAKGAADSGARAAPTGVVVCVGWESAARSLRLAGPPGRLLETTGARSAQTNDDGARHADCEAQHSARPPLSKAGPRARIRVRRAAPSAVETAAPSPKEVP
jgi:hypothetical protein